MNTFGNIFRLTSFGESHGSAMGGVIDGVPAGILFSLKEMQQTVDARRPGTKAGASPRRESDRVRILSGLMAYNQADGSLSALTDDTDIVISLGTSIGFMVENGDARPGAYDVLREVYRPNHADITYDCKYGVRDWRGGGRSSGRETVSRVVAGAFAAQALRHLGVEIHAEVTGIGGETDPYKFPALLAEAARQGDSLGGVVSVRITGVPAGWGEPVFGKLQQMLAGAMLSIGGVHGFEYGDGFALAAMRGSEAADEMYAADVSARENVAGDPCNSGESSELNETSEVAPSLRFASNHCGGILGGISTGQDIVLRVAFKPTPTIRRELHTVRRNGTAPDSGAVCDTTLNPGEGGRHDVCIALRGCPVVAAMAALTLYDASLLARASLCRR